MIGISVGIIQDIITNLQDDVRHNVRVVIDSEFLTVYLDDDPELNLEEKKVIPIRYNRFEDYCYIPHDEYCEMMQDNDFGIDIEEINLIQRIMLCIENNKDEIQMVCGSLSCENRKPLIPLDNPTSNNDATDNCKIIDVDS